MRILFVYPNIVESPKDISSGLAILISIAKNQGHECELIDSTFGITDEEIKEKIIQFNPDLAAITTATNDFEYACHISKLIKQIKNIPIIAGGFHPTIAPEEAINQEYIDIICIGEGEEAFKEFLINFEKSKNLNHSRAVGHFYSRKWVTNLKSLQSNGVFNPFSLNKSIEKIARIKNLWIKICSTASEKSTAKRGTSQQGRDKYDKKIIKNETCSLNQNLDSIPFPDRELFNYSKYLNWNHGTATFITTRGCPFQCTYCINHFLIKEYKNKGKYVRYRSINNLFAEIKQVLKQYPQIKNIEFHDDTFTLDDKRIKEFCARYKDEIGIPFNINARVNAVNPELFQELKNAGCVRVSIGIESGDEYIRNKILKRNMTDEQIINTFQAAKKAGLKTYSFNMVGIPYETKESIKKTITLNKKCRPDYVGVSIFNAFKGTELYEICKKEGLLKTNYARSYFRDSNIAHPNFTIKQLRRIRNSFGFKVFISYKPVRAVIDLIDRNLSQIDKYILIRSKLMDKLNVLRK